MAPRPPPVPWAVVVAGLVVQAVALIVATVGLAHTAATIDGDDESNLGAAVFTDLFGPFLYAIAAVLVGLAALLVVAALAASIRPGGRFTGLVVGVGAQVPVLGWSVWAVVDGEDPAGVLLAVLVGGAAVVLGALVPTTWRWTRRRPPVAVTS